MTKDTLIVPLSDMHSGGTTALFPKRFWQFKHGNHTPTDEQKAMFDHFAACAKTIAKARQGKRLVIVHDGDAIDGVHHGTLQIVTHLINEQIDIHIDLMDYFLQTVGFDRRSDKLYYVTGTEVHTGDVEDLIGKDLGAEPKGDLYAWDELDLPVNGRRVWFLHHGPKAGDGPNKGNALRNWLRRLFYNQRDEGKTPPDVIVTGHTHVPYWQIYIGLVDGEYFPVRGLICPSWQRRTRYSKRIAPMQQGKIGLQYFVITKDGMISDPVEMLMKQSTPQANEG